MNQIVEERRLRHKENQQRVPYGTIAMLSTGCIVTLVGVFAGIEPFDVLIRTTVSALAMGLLVSTGVSVVRVAGLRRN